MHVDGSAMASMFFIPDVAAILPDSLEPLHGGHLYVLVNGGFRTPEATTRNQTVSIVRRSAAAALQGGTRAALELAYSAAQRHQMSVAVGEIPDAYPFGGMLDFDASRMKALFSFGEHCALLGQLWTDPIDALVRRRYALCPSARTPFSGRAQTGTDRIHNRPHSPPVP